LLAVTQLQPAAAQTNQLVNDAVKALGGADAMRGLKAVSITGEAKYWEPGQAKVAGGEPKHVEDVTFTVIRDLAGSMGRTQWDRDHKYPDPALRIKYLEVVTTTGGFVTDDKEASAAMSGVSVAAAERGITRCAPHRC